MFAFGFFTPGKSSYRYVGIWFHKIPEPSYVWVANRNHPVNGSSGFLSLNGNLVLYNDPGNKFPVWSTNLLGKVIDPCVVQLLNSGNLVLLHGRNGKVVWQSFDFPTDTHLPGMKLGKNKKTGFEWSLTSWKSPDDPGIGEFSVKNVANKTIQIFLYKGSKRVWRAPIWPYVKFSNLYKYEIVDNDEESYTVYYITDDTIVTRTMVDHMGHSKWIRWSESDGEWKELWSLPINQCDLYAHCGTYGKCNPGNSDAFECSCLPGYEPRSPRDWYLRVKTHVINTAPNLTGQPITDSFN